MPDPLTQQLLPFGDPPEQSHADAVRNQPGEEALAALDRLEAWLTDPRGRMTESAEDAVLAARQALVEGKSSYHHQAQDFLEALKLRNGPAQGDDIPAEAWVATGEDFYRAVDGVLDALHERFLARGRVR